MPKKKRTGKPAPRTYDLRSYIREAKREPFPLRLDDETVLSIEAPTVDRIFDAAKLDTSDVEASLKILVGDEVFEEFIEAIGEAPSGVLNPLIKDIQAHFNLGDQGESDAS
ncbi:hypothetical protein NE857_09140 [Nocardiopsis exhalans]|uniref:Tail assembly chaperone n=1 Tax=Nocardiopsis exhalans TaxID=163604 RepID=A0ABY5DF71_9ACTN|nr:hypothetical protein [Nocardiopsis exhalans]USY21746.1 hypothetical protein NE857_09140 [Nocardiopsis exhalans]